MTARKADFPFFRITALALLVPLVLFSFAAAGPLPGGPLRIQAAAAEENCGDCGEDQGGLLCPFKYLIYFIWFALMAVAAAVAVVMDLATGFTQGYVKGFVRWVVEKTKDLDRFFRARGCA